MTKAEFLKALEEKLSALSAQDRVASLAYYEEIIDDRMEEGLCEADAVAAAGPVEEAAAQLLAETPHAETRLCAQPKRIEPAGSFLLFTDPFDAVEIHAACADVELWPSEDGVCRVEFQEEQRCAASRGRRDTPNSGAAPPSCRPDARPQHRRPPAARRPNAGQCAARLSPGAHIPDAPGRDPLRRDRGLRRPVL